MEWAIGKNYDVYPRISGKLLLPGAHIWWEFHNHAVEEQMRDHAELAVYLYPKGQEPKNRTRLMTFGATARTSDGGGILDMIITKPRDRTALRWAKAQPQEQASWRPRKEIPSTSRTASANAFAGWKAALP
jgi:hypothetical protein